MTSAWAIDNGHVETSKWKIRKKRHTQQTETDKKTYLSNQTNQKVGKRYKQKYIKEVYNTTPLE